VKSKTDEKALEAAIEKALTVRCLEDKKHPVIEWLTPRPLTGNPGFKSDMLITSMQNMLLMEKGFGFFLCLHKGKR